MPQMAPMLWLMLFLMINVIYLYSLINLYFNQLQLMPLFTKSHMLKQKQIIIPW